MKTEKGREALLEEYREEVEARRAGIEELTDVIIRRFGYIQSDKAIDGMIAALVTVYGCEVVSSRLPLFRTVC